MDKKTTERNYEKNSSANMTASKKSISQQARIKTKTLKRDNSRKPLDLQELKTEINSNTIIYKNKSNFIPSTVID